MIQNICLHRGSTLVDREVLEKVLTPPETRTWRPISHLELLSQVETAAQNGGFTISGEKHALSQNGDRYFGVIEIKVDYDDYSYVIGVRNSHDKSFPAGVVAGTKVFVCDNLAFTGEITVTRKHTVMIRQDLPGLVNTAMAGLVGHWKEQDDRIQRYKRLEMADAHVHDLTIMAMDERVISTRQIPKVLGLWRKPNYAEFSARTLWSWFNAVTETVRDQIETLPNRTRKLYEVCDRYTGPF